MSTEQEFLDTVARTATSTNDHVFILTHGDSVQRDAILARMDLPVETLAFVAAHVRLTPQGVQRFAQQRNVTVELLAKASARSL